MRSARVMLEVNALGETLRDQRLGALEATALLRTVMAEIDVAVFAFDERATGCGSSTAPASGCSAQPAERLLGRTAERARPRGRASTATSPRIDGRRPSPAASGRWEVRRSDVPPGRPAAPAARARRPQPAAARGRAPGVAAADPRARPRDQQLARADQVDRRQPASRCSSAQPPPADCATTICARGLAVIGARSEALSRFMRPTRGSRDCRRPTAVPLDVATLVRRVAALETRLPVRVERRPAVDDPRRRRSARQLLINLVRNAVDAALETGGGVEIRWTRQHGNVALDWSRTKARGSRRAPVRPVLHDQARGLRHRARAQPPDRRGPRRLADAREPSSSRRMCRHAAT